MTHNVMNLYIETVYLEYIFDTTGSKDYESMLILDCATIHLVDDEFNPFFKYNINEICVSKGLTSVCQPLDMTINKLIKDEMKRQYLGWRTSLLDNINTKVKRQNVIDWLCNCWKSEKVVFCELIKNTFKQVGVTVFLTGEENKEIKIFEKLKEVMPNNFLNEEKYEDNIIELNRNNIIDEL